MTLSLSSSLMISLNALRHNAAVLDSRGIILFTNDSWKEYTGRFGLSPLGDWVGTNALEQFIGLLSAPSQITKLSDALQEILQGDSLLSVTEFILQTSFKGHRLFRVNAFPLINQYPEADRAIVLSLQDAGPVALSRHTQPRSIQSLRSRENAPCLVPICASCKSVRNNSEEWITVERFLQQQLSLQFTHDICPDCIRQLYPKYAGALKR